MTAERKPGIAKWCDQLYIDCLVEPCSDRDNRRGRCPATTKEQKREMNQHLAQRRKIRSEAHQNWLGRPPYVIIKSPPPALVEARCLSSSCGSRGLSYMTYDLEAFVPTELKSLNGKEPVIGPCPACGGYTNEVVESK